MKHKFLTLLAVLTACANFSWAVDYCVAHNGKLSSKSWDAGAEKMSLVSGTVYSRVYTSVGTDQIEFKITEGSWNVSYNSVDNNASDVEIKSDGNIKFTLDAASDVTIYFDSNTKKAWVKLPAPDPSAPVSGNLLDVLKGDKVMVYGGELKSWNQTSYYFMSENNTSKKVATATMSDGYTIGSESCRFGVATLPVGTYYQGHWASGMKCAVEVGGAYIVRGSASGSYYTQKANSGSNYIYKVVAGAAPTTTATTTIDATILPGSKITVSTSSAAGVSSLNKTNAFKYYLFDGTNYYEKEISEGKIDVSDLAAGNGYKIITVLFDGKLYVRADVDEFSVQAEAGNHSISYPTATKWTYGEDKPTQAKKNDLVSFTATPNAGYTLAVSSEQATIAAGENNTYSFTMPDEDVTISITATAQEFGITYPASPINYTLDSSNPVKGTTDAEISFTATPNEGYQLTVTSEQVASFNKNGNTYSFTMPAQAVTIAIEATLIPKTTFYFWNSGGWAKVNTHLWGGTASGTNWPGVEQTTIAYQSDGKNIYKVVVNQGDYASVIFNNGSGTQTGDLTIPTSGDNICYKGQNGGWMALPEENYAVEISAGNGGSVTQAGTKYVASTAFTVNANADPGYVFKNWTATGGVVIADADEASTTITATAAGTLTANFEADLTKFAINFSAEGGSASAKVNGEAISSGKMYTVGESVDVTFTASPSGSKTFYGWFDSDNNKVSDLESFTAEGITSTYTVKAVYAGKYYLKHPWNQGDWTVKEVTYDVKTGLYYIYENYGNNGFNYGSDPNNLGWNGSPTTVDSPAAKDWCYITTNTSGAITVKKVTETYTITANAVEAEGTTTVNATAGAADVLEGKSATLVATANDSYGFVGWYDNAEKTGDAVSTEATYVLDAVFAEATYYAKFEKETQYTVTIANNVDATTTSTQVGASVKEVTADARDGYVFRNWTTDGDITIVGAATDNPVSITATGEGTLTANYDAKKNIYLQNTLGWEGDIYAYLFKGDVWDGWIKHKGVVAAAGKMVSEGNGLYSFEYDDAEACAYIAFATGDMISWGDFYGNKAIYRGDYDSNTPIFVPQTPQTAQTLNTTEYYNSGTWQTSYEPAYYLKYPWGTGLDADWSWKKLEIANEDGSYSIYDLYGGEGKGINYNTSAADAGATYVEFGAINVVGEPQTGKAARFTYNPQNNAVTIENMYFPIAMNAYGYATLYHNENLQIPDGVTAKYVTGTSGAELTYQEVQGGVIPKKTGVMLFATADMQMDFVGVAEAYEEAPANIMDGSHESEVVNNSDIHYILTLNSNSQIGMFWPYGTNRGVGSFTNAANKAYIYLPGTTQQPAGVMARKGFLLTNDVNTPTGVGDVNANVNVNGKVLMNNQLIIIREGKRYNAQGIRL